MPGERILLLDTEKNVLLAYQAVLGVEGYLVSIATTIQEARQKLFDHHFEILITELYLKGENTTTIIKDFKEQFPEIYIIVTTAVNLHPENYEEIINAGVDDYFTKPLSPKLLVATIKKGIKRRFLISKNIYLENKLKKMEGMLSSHNYGGAKGKIIPDMHSFSKILHNEMVRAKRYNHPFSLIIVETHSHEKKTKDLGKDNQKTLLNGLSDILTIHTRKTDIVTGYNGNYALILVETSENGTITFINRLQNEITNLINTSKPPPIKLTEIMKIDYFSFPDQSDSICRLIDDTN